ncbi:hypothetical protein M2140_000812 [Clostridiales Family XIII bacterium PM5-7]
MKRKILGIVLTMTLVLTTVFAGTQSVFAETSDVKLNAQNVQALTGETVVPQNLLKNVDTIQTHVKYNSSAEPMYIKFKMPYAGTMIVDYSNYGSVKIKAKASADAPEIKTTVNGFSYLGQADKFTATQGKEYYLEIPAYGQATFSIYYAPKTSTITKGTEFYGYGGMNPGTSVTYYKVTAPSTGYLTINFTGTSTSYPTYNVKLTNSKKTSYKYAKGYERISSSSSNKNYTTRLGVKKGTYYIAVKTSDPLFAADVTFTKVVEKSGSTKSKATRLYKAGTTKKGIITVAQGTSPGDWYKFTIKKRQKVSVRFNTAIGGYTGGLKLSLYSGSRSYADAYTTVKVGETGGSIPIYTVGKTTLGPGTYYLKVSKSGQGNGYYELQWE